MVTMIKKPPKVVAGVLLDTSESYMKPGDKPGEPTGSLRIIISFRGEWPGGEEPDPQEVAQELSGSIVVSIKEAISGIRSSNDIPDAEKQKIIDSVIQKTIEGISRTNPAFNADGVAASTVKSIRARVIDGLEKAGELSASLQKLQEPPVLPSSDRTLAPSSAPSTSNARPSMMR